MALQPFRDEQLNFFKFSSIVLNEFPRVVRQTFKTMWDNTLAHRPGFQLWDDSTAVRNLFASIEGARTRVPTNLSYSEWDCTALFQATIYAQSFALPASTGHFTTLSDLYVKPRGIPHGSFHKSVVSAGGNDAETFALAIDQLRLLRNLLCHSISSEMDKVTFDECVKSAKDAFQALGVKTARIDAVCSLNESDFPTNEVRKLEKGIREEARAYISFLEGLGSDINEAKVLLNATKQTVTTIKGDTANIAILEQKISELKVAQEERNVKNANECTSIVKGVSDLKSLSTAIKQATSDAANKEDIEMIKQEIGEMKKAQDRNEEENQAFNKILEGVSSDISALKKKIKGEAADKEDIAMLEQKIAELKVAQNERDAQLKSSGAKPSIPRTCLPSIVSNFTGRQSECEEIIGHVTSESTRLVSIWGSPGFGKTSVAIAVGHALQSKGLSVCWVSLRGLKSKADLTSKLLSFVSQPAPKAQPSVQRLSLDDELCQLISEISERSVFILDNADDLLESGLPKIKEEVMQLLEEILRRNRRLAFAVTTRESFEFMNLHFQGHQGVRIRPLDEASAQILVHELLPNASASSCSQITQICGRVPLAIKLLCSLISEESIPPSQFLDDFMKSPTESTVEMLDNPDYQTSHRLQFLFNSSFQRLTAQEQEALVSLSILPENFSTEVSAAVLGKTRIPEARKILQSLRRKSLLDSSSKPSSFTIHKLLQSFAREKGESEMKETALNSKRRLNAFYISLFEKLNEQFLTGHSMKAFIAFYEDKQYFVQSLIEGCSDSKTADSVFEVLVKAELFLDSLFWCEGEGTNFYDIYDSALKAANLYGKDNYHRQLLTSRAFAEVTWGPNGNTMQLLSRRNAEIQAPSSPFSTDEKGKHLCYLGIFQLVTGDTESGVQCLQEALPLLDNFNNPEQTILRLVIFQFLIVCYKSLNDSSSASHFYDKALQECSAAGDSQLLIIPPINTKIKDETDDKIKLQKDRGISPNSQPLKVEIVFLLSEAAKFCSDTETEQYMCNIALQILKEIETEVPGSLGLFNFYRNVVELLRSFDNIEDPVKLYESRINYHKTALKQWKENSSNNDNLGSFDQVHSEALAKCYLDLGEVYQTNMNYPEALQAKRRALEITIKLFKDEHASTAKSYHSLGLTQHSLGDFTSALESKQRALQIRLKLFGEEHASTADIYYSLETTQHALGDFTSALESAQRALQIRLKLFGEEHASTADSYDNLGDNQHSLCNFTSALESTLRALHIRLKLFGEEHAITADSYDNLGTTQHSLGDFTSALESTQRALHIRLKLFGEKHARTADSYYSLAITQHSLGDFTSALQSNQCALTIRIEVLGEDHASTADSYYLLGITQHSLGYFTSAVESTQRALYIRLKLFGEEHASTADSYHNLGATQHSLGDLTSALKCKQRALHIRLKLFGEEHASTADSYYSLAISQHSLGDFNSALQSDQHALTIRIKALGEENASTADSYYSLAITQHSLGDFSSALQSDQRALHIRLKRFGEEHASTADSYYSLWINENTLGDFTSALESAQRALHIRLKLFGEEHARTADSYHNLGTTQHSLGDFTSALESKQRALRIRLELYGEEHARTADSYHNLGTTQHSLGDLTSALESTQRALYIRLKLFGEEHASTADSYFSLAITQYSLGDFTSALQSDQRALTIRIKVLGEEHASTADSYYLLGITKHSLGNFSSALESAQRALYIRLKLLGEEHASTADSYYSLAITQHSLGDFTSALQTGQCALTIRIKVLGEEHASTADSYYLLGIIQHSLADFTSALESTQRALEIRRRLFGEKIKEEEKEEEE